MRHSGSFTWVECKRKNCKATSGYVNDMTGSGREECTQIAIELWNKAVSMNG